MNTVWFEVHNNIQVSNKFHLNWMAESYGYENFTLVIATKVVQFSTQLATHSPLLNALFSLHWNSSDGKYLEIFNEKCD